MAVENPVDTRETTQGPEAAERPAATVDELETEAGARMDAARARSLAELAAQFRGGREMEEGGEVVERIPTPDQIRTSLEGITPEDLTSMSPEDRRSVFSRPMTEEEREENPDTPWRVATAHGTDLLAGQGLSSFGIDTPTARVRLPDGTQINLTRQEGEEGTISYVNEAGERVDLTDGAWFAGVEAAAAATEGELTAPREGAGEVPPETPPEIENAAIEVRDAAEAVDAAETPDQLQTAAEGFSRAMARLGEMLGHLVSTITPFLRAMGGMNGGGGESAEAPNTPPGTTRRTGETPEAPARAAGGEGGESVPPLSEPASIEGIDLPADISNVTPEQKQQMITAITESAKDVRNPERLSQLRPELLCFMHYMVQRFPGQLRITSTLRTPEENRSTRGSARRSLHMSGLAVDFGSAQEGQGFEQQLMAAAREWGERYSVSLELPDPNHGTGRHVHVGLRLA